MENTDLISYTKSELELAKGRWTQISEESGIGYSWLQKFAQNRIPNPGAKRIQALANYFLRKKKEQAILEKQRAEFRAGIGS